MMSVYGKRGSRILSLVCGLSVFGATLFYMAQWLQMPLYPDEVALRIAKARFLADGALEYSLLPQCPSNTKEIPLIFRPVAYLFSAFDFSFNWSLVRMVPVAGAMFALGAGLLVIHGRRASAAMLMPAAGFIGVAGAGLVLFRMEAPLVFYGASCVLGYALVRRDEIHPVIVGAYLALSTLLALLSFFVHIQSLILAPLGILLAAGLMIRQRSNAMRLFACLCAICIAIGALTILAVPEVKCPGLPKLERFFSVMTLPGFAKHEGLIGVEEYLGGKLDSYKEQFLFKKKYDYNYLPEGSLDESTPYFASLNTVISLTVLLNLLIACGVFVYAGVETIRILISGRHSFRESMILMTTAPAVYLFLATAGHLALFIVDVPTNFYRAFYINFALVMINALALAGLKGAARSALWPMGAVSLVLCVLSATATRVEIKPKFLAGWAGPSISLNTDWSAARLAVTELAGKCGIAAKDPRIIIDDLTFDAMRSHPHLMPVTYIGVAYNPDDAGVKKQPEFIRAFGATHLLARCVYFPLYKIDPDVRSDDLCCAKL
jgi:hypothetical protein